MPVRWVLANQNLQIYNLSRVRRQRWNGSTVPDQPL